MLVCFVFDNLKKRYKIILWLYSSWQICLLKTLPSKSHTTNWASFNSGMFSGMAFSCWTYKSISSKCCMKQELEFQTTLENKIKISHDNYLTRRLQTVPMSLDGLTKGLQQTRCWFIACGFPMNQYGLSVISNWFLWIDCFKRLRSLRSSTGIFRNSPSFQLLSRSTHVKTLANCN